MKDEDLPDDWPGEPVSTASLVKLADGTVKATINGEEVSPEDVPQLVETMRRAEERDT